MLLLENKIAVVTGGSSGIGLATAQRFVEQGAYRDTDTRKQLLALIDLIKLEPYRQALDDLDPIAGRVRRRQDCKIRTVPGLMLTTCALTVRSGKASTLMTAC
jgi:NAD(P)-dependent dehydrogenase (short-subunit alcohol dehydrogenase family)